MPTLTPNEVAKRSGMSRRTIMRAITKGELAAKRTNTGWEIDEQDYAAWASAHAPADEQAHVTPTPENSVHAQLIRLSTELGGLRELLSAERRLTEAERLRAVAAERARDQAEIDRDEWRSMAQRSWWKRLVG